MKKTVFIILLMVPLIHLKSQTTNLPKKDTIPSFYLGLGTGIDNYAGMVGIGSEIRIADLLFVRLGAGIGGWGYKFAFGLKYETKHTNNWGMGVYYTNSSGLKNFETNLEVYEGNSNSTTKKDVKMDLYKASTLNLSVSRNWIIKHKNKFFIEFGYAVPLTEKAYKIKDDSRLTDLSVTVIEMMQPGGVIISAGFLFGLN